MANTITREGKGNRGKGDKKVTSAKKQDKPVIKKKNFSFYYKFSDSEAKEKAKQLADAVTEKTRIEDNKKSEMSNFKSKIDGKITEINLLSGQVSSGAEYVTKTCECLYDFDRGVKEYVYEGKIVGSEKMTAADHQLSLIEAEEAAQEKK